MDISFPANWEVEGEFVEIRVVVEAVLVQPANETISASAISIVSPCRTLVGKMDVLAINISILPSFVFHRKGEKKKRYLYRSALLMNNLLSSFLLFHPGSNTVSSNAVDPSLEGYRLFAVSFR